MNATKTNPSPEERRDLHALLGEFDNAMFVTSDPQGVPRARPMTILDHGKDGQVWFVTRRGTGKVWELREDSRAGITAQGSAGFVSMSGWATLVPDRERLQALWRPELTPWFPDGPEDPEALLIRFDATEAEYWKTGIAASITLAFEAAKALIKGEPVEPPKHAHAEISLS